MSTPPLFTIIPDLAAEVRPPTDGILSRTIFQDDRVKAVLFGFDAGQELSEHTASVPALIQVISGEGTVSLGPESVEARPGTWIHMPAGLPHAIAARSPLVLLLLLLREPTPR